MISYTIYKWIHLSSLILFFSLLGAQCFQKEVTKIQKISFGVLSVFILVSGMGLLARLGVAHTESWPFWIYFKMGVWLLLSALTPIVVKRFSRWKNSYYLVSMVLASIAVWVVIHKIQ